MEKLDHTELKKHLPMSQSARVQCPSWPPVLSFPARAPVLRRGWTARGTALEWRSWTTRSSQEALVLLAPLDHRPKRFLCFSSAAPCVSPCCPLCVPCFPLCVPCFQTRARQPGVPHWNGEAGPHGAQRNALSLPLPQPVFTLLWVPLRVPCFPLCIPAFRRG